MLDEVESRCAQPACTARYAGQGFASLADHFLDRREQALEEQSPMMREFSSRCSQATHEQICALGEKRRGLLPPRDKPHVSYSSAEFRCLSDTNAAMNAMTAPQKKCCVPHPSHKDDEEADHRQSRYPRMQIASRCAEDGTSLNPVARQPRTGRVARQQVS